MSKIFDFNFPVLDNIIEEPIKHDREYFLLKIKKQFEQPMKDHEEDFISGIIMTTNNQDFDEFMNIIYN